MAILELNADNFQTETAGGLVVVEFYSDSCNVCQMMQPVLKELAQKHKYVKVCKINATLCRQICLANRVLSLPTVLIFKSGAVVEKLTGFKPASELEAILTKVK